MTLQDEKGYTLIEVLTALVLLFLILTPTTYVITKLITGADIEDRRNANIICINTAEKALLMGETGSAEENYLFKGRRYQIRKKLESKREGLQLFSVTVSRHKRILSELHHVLPALEER
ncbi:MAG: type IV pilus modification PilV family protein [Calditrichia bacterium]